MAGRQVRAGRQLLAAVGCAGVASCAPLLERGSGQDEAALARSVTIVRDAWGVPHIHGPTDASVMFGAAFAQAEDNYWQVEEDYIHALGRASHYWGERYLAADLVKAVFEVERLAREEYAREPTERRVLWDAFAAGLNYYLRVSGLQPRLITRWEPWMLFARTRTVTAGSAFDGVVLDTIGEAAGIQLTGRVVGGAGAPGAAPSSSGRGAGSAAVAGVHAASYAHAASVAVAVAPSRSSSGEALLLQSVYAPLFGPGQLYELHLHSDAGLHVRGFALLGTPLPVVGHNARVGWGHSAGTSDAADVYAVRFDDTDALTYRVDDTPMRATEWADTLQVNTMDGVVPRVYRFRRTHHGPIVAIAGGRGFAVRIARMEEGGALQQWLAMARAQDLASFTVALSQTALTSNTTYADADGNIMQVRGNAVPVRNPALDWSGPVDGNRAQTDWQGYHPLSELPQATNPATGILLSGALPVADASRGTPSDAGPRRYPSYMHADVDYARVRPGTVAGAAAAVDSGFSLESLTSAAFDTRVADIRDEVTLLVMEWEEVGGLNPQRAMQLDEAIDTLRGWDGRATTASVATTLFVLWRERLRSGEYAGSLERLSALEDVVRRLRLDWDSVRVPWGELNRLQRVHSGGIEPFRDERESVAIAGVPAWAGTPFSFDAPPAGPARRRYGVAASHVGVVQFGPRIVARSIVPMGQSADPASPVYFDQAALYSRNELKPAWFDRADVTAAARRTYRPSESVTVPLRPR